MYYMSGGSAYLFVIIKYFSFAFFLLLIFCYVIKPPQPRYAIYRAPPFTGNLLFYFHLNAHIETCTYMIHSRSYSFLFTL